MPEDTTFSNLSERLAGADAPSGVLEEVLAKLESLQGETSGLAVAGASRARYERLRAVSTALAAARHVVILGLAKVRGTGARA